MNNVVAAIIKKNNQFLIVQRNKNKHLGLKWEFPGGKVKENETLLKAMRHYDYTVNVTWVMAHYNTAKKYLNHGKEPEEATGGSDWAKYMHPKYQKRIFFPSVWSEKEIKDWGKNV